MASGSHLLTGAVINHGGVPTTEVDCQEPVRAGIDLLDLLDYLMVVPFFEAEQAQNDGVQVFFS